MFLIAKILKRLKYENTTATLLAAFLLLEKQLTEKDNKKDLVNI